MKTAAIGVTSRIDFTRFLQGVEPTELPNRVRFLPPILPTTEGVSVGTARIKGTKIGVPTRQFNRGWRDYLGIGENA